METNQTYQNELGSAMLPFVMRELVDTVMKRKALPLEDALYYIYSSNLYKALLDESTKLWYSSTLSLYDMLEKEKAEQKKVQKDNQKILLFQMFCAENYREAKKISAKETLLLFSNHGIFEFLHDNFELLHTQDTEYILDTIVTYINKKAWNYITAQQLPITADAAIEMLKTHKLSFHTEKVIPLLKFTESVEI